VVRQIEPREVAVKLSAKEPIYFLDVRRPEEHALAALPGSVLIPLHELQARVGEVRPEDGALLVAYCHHGVRSLSAAAFLERSGFKDVASLAGGIDAWSLEVDANVPRY
jgi:adenylyltransferase/sulfurtransferase